MASTATMQDLKHLRVDQVGGLSCPVELRRVFDDYKRGAATEDEFERAKDAAVRHVIAKQQAIGFPILTDGELRRRNFQESFSESVSGFEVPAEDKSMEGVSLAAARSRRAEFHRAGAGDPARGAASSSGSSLCATFRCRNICSPARSRPAR